MPWWCLCPGEYGGPLEKSLRYLGKNKWREISIFVQPLSPKIISTLHFDLEVLQKFSLCADFGHKTFSWEEKLVAPLIATPNVDRAIEDKKDGQKSYITGYMCNSRLQKGITILFLQTNWTMS